MAAFLRRRRASGRAAVQVYAMGAGYLLVWVMFSIGATVPQRVLSGMLILNPMMEMPNRTAIGATLRVSWVLGALMLAADGWFRVR
jgi:predicted metal-binding membrane protein